MVAEIDPETDQETLAEHVKQRPVEMVHYMPDDESWLTAAPPVRCPQCGVTAALTIDPANQADVANVGQVMAQLVQAKRDEHHAEHHAGQHDGSQTAICHHCRDNTAGPLGSCATCRQHPVPLPSALPTRTP